MENIYPNILLLLLLSTLATGTSAQSAASSIQGSWQMEAQRMVADRGAAFDSLPAARRQRLLKSFASRVFVFSGGGDFSARWEAGDEQQSVQGTWTLSDQGKLSITLPTGTSVYALTFPAAGSMVLEPAYPAGGMARKLHFIKPKKP